MKNKKSPGFAFGKAGAFPFERKRTGGKTAQKPGCRKKTPFSYATPAMSDYFFFMMVRFMISLTTALSTTVATVAGTYTSQKE